MERGEGLTKLKRDLAHNRYDIDSDAVADAILRKLELIRHGRSALAEREAGRIRQPGTGRHRAA